MSGSLVGIDLANEIGRIEGKMLSNESCVAIERALSVARSELAACVAALEEVTKHGCFRASDTAGPVDDAYDHLAACVNLAATTLASLTEAAKAHDREAEARGLERGAEIVEVWRVRRGATKSLADRLREKAAKVREGRYA